MEAIAEYIEYYNNNAYKPDEKARLLAKQEIKPYNLLKILS